MPEQQDAALSPSLALMRSSPVMPDEGATMSQEAKDFWQSSLAEVPQFLDLPTDNPRPTPSAHQQATVDWAISSELRESLATLSSQAGVQLSTTLLAAFALLLSRSARQTDFVIAINGGGVLAGPTMARHIVPLRIAVADNPPVRTFLTSIHTGIRAASQYADVSWARICDILHIQHELGTHPLAQTAFIWQETDAMATNGQPFAAAADHARFDVALVMTATTRDLRGMWHYDAALFREATMQRMVDHFTRLLASMVATPEQRIATLPMLGPEEWQLLVATRNATQADYSRELFVHQTVEWHALHHPSALAVDDGTQQMTYGELNLRANHIAHLLIHHGVRAETVVGICLERSLDMIVALLGVLKAGGAYLPIDPAYPAERRAFIMRDANLAALITQPALAADSTMPQVVLLSPNAPELQRQPRTNPSVPMLAEQLAYVIYTSGSTGVPKGAQISHGSLRNLCTWYQRAFTITANDRMSQFVSPGFDATIMEIWPCLTSGASLHIVNEEVRLEAAALRDWLVAQRITISMIPTALAEQLLMLAWPTAATLRYLLTGAEALRVYPPVTFPAAFINNYGPTEATVLVTSGQVLPSTATEIPPSIGRQIANTSLYLLDDHLQPVPEGVVGELYIGGLPVGRGYVGRPDLTAERFLPDPFSTHPGARLYRTGDLCRYRANGEIEYSGRADDQIKLRGYRIELGEIEAVLLQQPSVRTAVVVVREDDSGEKRLIAYITPAADATPTANSLRDALQSRLPGYMLPTAVMVLGALPMTANGKVDRRALPAPDLASLATQTYIGPRTPTEAKLAQIWADVLGLARVGVEDDLFALGAHSLLATRISSRTREAFQIAMPLRVLFEEPTIAQMARYITHRQATATPTPDMAVLPIQQARRGDEYLSDLLDQLEPIAEADTLAFFTEKASNV